MKDQIRVTPRLVVYALLYMVTTVAVAVSVGYTIQAENISKIEVAFDQNAALVREAAIDACQAENLSRKEFVKHGRILQAFLNSAAQAREIAATAIREGTGREIEARANENAARRWRADADKIEVVAALDCEEIFPIEDPDEQNTPTG